MSLELRSGGVCELCKSDIGLSAFDIEPSDGSTDTQVYLCSNCKDQIDSNNLDEAHFNCLNDSMWSETLPVAVLSYRLLKKLGRADLYEMIYFDDEAKKWADSEATQVEVKDSNGVLLKNGDSVVIIKDLEVKGAGFTAKRGTTVKNITIPNDVEGHIEGRVNGVKIYLKTEFLKKA